MLSADVRRAIGRAVAAAGFDPADPGLRPTGTPGQFTSSIAFALGEHGPLAAPGIAAQLNRSDLIKHAGVTGPGFITITLRPEALADLPERIIAAGPACASSAALHGLTTPAPPAADPLAAPSWAEAQATLAAQLTARLATAAGATITPSKERTRPSPHPAQFPLPGEDKVRSSASGSRPVAAAVAFAGADAVLFALARVSPGRPPGINPRIIARHAVDNPAYAVRYAHARAVAELRWAAEYSRGGYGGSPPRKIAVLLDALAWLPERVAAAGRRGRPDEFARYLEELARVTVDALIDAGDPPGTRVPGADRLALAGAARTGLAAGLGLLGISAPDRL